MWQDFAHCTSQLRYSNSSSLLVEVDLCVYKCIGAGTREPAA